VALGDTGERLAATEEQKREQARERVRQDARRGQTPSTSWAAEDLAWAFRGLEDELDELETVAVEAREAIAARREASARSNELRHMIEVVDREWQREAAAERKRKLETEARKRLGLS
jgi:hypothetical protein